MLTKTLKSTIENRKSKMLCALMTLILLFSCAPARAFTTPLPLMVNSNYVIVGPTNALQIFQANFGPLTNALALGGFSGGGGGGGSDVTSLNGLQGGVISAVSLIGSNGVSLYLTTNSQTLQWNLAYNTNWVGTNVVVLMGTTISNTFETITAAQLIGTTITNNFETITAAQLIGTTITNNFATLTFSAGQGQAITNFIGSISNLNLIVDWSNTNAPFFKTSLNIKDALGVATNGVNGFWFTVDTAGNVRSAGSGTFTNGLSAPNFIQLGTGKRAMLTPNDKGTNEAFYSDGSTYALKAIGYYQITPYDEFTNPDGPQTNAWDSARFFELNTDGSTGLKLYGNASLKFAANSDGTVFAASNITATAFIGNVAATSLTGTVGTNALPGLLPQLSNGDGGSVTNLMRTITAVLDYSSSGSAIPTGLRGVVRVPYDCKIIEGSILADQVGSMAVDVFVCNTNNYDGGATHPVVGDKITGSSPLTISSGTKVFDSTLSGWSPTLYKTNVVGFYVNSASVIQRATVSLRVLTQ